MTRWHNGHATIVGVMLGLLLASHVWLVFVLGLALGLSVTQLRRAVAAAAAWVTTRRAPAAGDNAGRPLRGVPR